MSFVLGQFYKTQAGAIARIKQHARQDHGRTKWCVIVSPQGFLVVSESALKNVGLLPRRKNGVKLSPSGILRKRRLAI